MRRKEVFVVNARWEGPESNAQVSSAGYCDHSSYNLKTFLRKLQNFNSKQKMSAVGYSDKI